MMASVNQVLQLHRSEQDAGYGCLRERRVLPLSAALSCGGIQPERALSVCTLKELIMAWRRPRDGDGGHAHDAAISATSRSSTRTRMLFYRLGDFYEMFFDDAHARLPRAGADPDRTRLRAGRARAHVRRALSQRWKPISHGLIEKGYKVAICEQMEDPATRQGAGRARSHARRHPRYA